MRKLTYSLIMVCLWGAAVSLGAQTTSGTITGSVVDAQLAIVPGATVTARNLATDQSRSVLTDEFGRFRLSNVPIGTYEVKVELTGFGAYVQSGVTVGVNQEAVLSVTLQPAGIVETVTVQEDAPPINTSNAEIGVRFDTRRIAELPLATNRNIFNIALSAPGVSQIGEGQSGFATGTNFSVNGMRLRSNNFMIDGQDSNDPSITGRQQPMNNPDIVQEIQLITNQFAAEYGRAAGSVMNVVTKSGTNDFHGTAFWFHNDNALNSRNNLDERTTPKAPFRIENQFGGTFGGPIVRGNTFFFGSYQRWTDRRQGSGTTLNGAPTEQGRQVLQNAVGARPHVAALLKFLPAAQTPIGRNATFTSGGQTFTVPLGSLTGSSARKINNDQFSTRIDHQFGQSHTLAGRYFFTNERDAGGGQVTPTGLTTIVPSRQQAANIWLTSTLSG
ncbi:MAG: TonB-dependent receptor, partial [Acidobacteria bacterium]|nr:TonB-dependent receptor [Acidobacteriota bacterium]